MRGEGPFTGSPNRRISPDVTGIRPALSTTGGTSDGRFLAAVSREVVEFGPLSASIHGIDEHVRIADLAPLSAIYEQAIAMLLSTR